jgi:hypothetical protein
MTGGAHQSRIGSRLSAPPDAGQPRPVPLAIERL